MQNTSNKNANCYLLYHLKISIAIRNFIKFKKSTQHFVQSKNYLGEFMKILLV